MRWLILLGAPALLLVPVAFWSNPVWVRAAAPQMAGIAADAITLDGRALVLCALAGLPLVALSLALLWRLWRLFGEYRAGRVFGRPALRHLRMFARWLLVLALLQPLHRTALALALTLGNPPGQRLLVVAIDGQDYLLILVALVLLAVATVMADAVTLAEENDGFV